MHVRSSTCLDSIPVFDDKTACPVGGLAFVELMRGALIEHAVALLLSQQMAEGADVDIERSWPAKRYESWEGYWASAKGLARNE